MHYARSLSPKARLAGTTGRFCTASPKFTRNDGSEQRDENSRFNSSRGPYRPAIQLATAMHAVNAAARARARGPSIKWTTPWLLLNRPPLRPFSIGSPLYGESQAKTVQTSTTETLATRLKQKRSADTQSHSSHDHAASSSSAGSKASTSTTANAPDQSHKGPHKIRVPTAGKAGEAAAGETRKDRKRAPIEGFKAKRFAMQRLRREQAQAVAEAHGDDWLGDEVSRVSVLLRLACFLAVKFRSGPRWSTIILELTRPPCTAQEPL